MVRFFMPKGVKMAKNEEKGEIVLYQPEGVPSKWR